MKRKNQVEKLGTSLGIFDKAFLDSPSVKPWLRAEAREREREREMIEYSW